MWGGFKKKIVTCLCGIIGLGVGSRSLESPANVFMLAILGSVVLGMMVPIANGPINR